MVAFDDADLRQGLHKVDAPSPWVSEPCGSTPRLSGIRQNRETIQEARRLSEPTDFLACTQNRGGGQASMHAADAGLVFAGSICQTGRGLPAYPHRFHAKFLFDVRVAGIAGSQGRRARGQAVNTSQVGIVNALQRSLRVFGTLSLLTLSAVTPASSVLVIVPGVISQRLLEPAHSGRWMAGAFLSIPTASACLCVELSSRLSHRRRRILHGRAHGRAIGRGHCHHVAQRLQSSLLRIRPSGAVARACLYSGVIIPGPQHDRCRDFQLILSTTVLGDPVYPDQMPG